MYVWIFACGHFVICSSSNVHSIDVVIQDVLTGKAPFRFFFAKMEKGNFFFPLLFFLHALKIPFENTSDVVVL